MKTNKQKGISLISLTITVIVLIIITSMLIYNAKNGIRVRALRMMENDIEVLDDKINAYYIRYGTLPIEIKYIGDINFTPQANDGEEYYVIDLRAIEGITLNYGLDFNSITNENDTIEKDDVYIINERSHHIYYAKGIQMDGAWYYTTEVVEEVPVKIIARLEMEEKGEKGVKLTLKASNRGEDEYRYKIYIEDQETGGARILKEGGLTKESTIEVEEFETFFDIGIKDAYAEITYDYGGREEKVETNHVSKEDMKIKYREELEYFRDKVNGGKTYEGQTITQIADINLQGSSSNRWTPIGTSEERTFKGIYEGRGHYIENLYINSTSNFQGLFGSNEGTIQNLTIESGTVTTTLGKVAGICGYNTGKIVGCINKANVSSTVGYIEKTETGYLRSDCGGIAGLNSYEGRIENCANLGNIFANGKLCGGISGFTIGGSIIKCYNKGNITSNAQQVGGIAGDIDGVYEIEGDGTVIVDSCYNTGEIKSNNSNIDGIVSNLGGNSLGVGGLVGCVFSDSELRNCYNIGKVIFTNNPSLNNIQNNTYGSITGNTYGNVSNTYYLNTTCNRGECNHTGTINNNGIKTSSELKNLATTLGTNFKKDTNNINNGYPILNWQ